MTLNEFERYCDEVESRNEKVPEDFFRKALEHILASYGQVCEEFEICRHPACNGSAGAWLVAHGVLEIADNVGKPRHDDGHGF